ncbi:MAG: 5-formyltetrahydrofolate cyclo-ligase [Desulfobulbaceae bacterium]|nr:5-formyltetrahydrofolate cyclo-ligase [Desulfobulbaceae bacterium]
MPEERKRLRTLKLKERDGIDPALRREKSVLICEKLLKIEDVARARTVMIYVDFRSEVETRPLFDVFYKRKIQVVVPLTVTKPPKLIPYSIRNPEKELHPGYCGIPEPDVTLAEAVDPAQINVVLVPGSVFDPQGGRLGYGGGYYDRFLSMKAPQALRVGLAYEAQVVDTVPVMEHDERMHYLITEKRLYKIK